MGKYSGGVQLDIVVEVNAQLLDKSAQYSLKEFINRKDGEARGVVQNLRIDSSCVMTVPTGEQVNVGYIANVNKGIIKNCENGGRIKDFVGQYSEYREYIKEKEETERAEQRSTTPQKPQQQRTHDTSKRKLSFKEQRELETIERELKELGEERTTLEVELNAGTADYNRLTEISKRIEEIIELIDLKEMRWLELND